MNTIRFTSVLNPDKYGFQFEPSSTEHFDRCYRTANILSYHAFYFETMGDGRTQHTPLSPVASIDLHTDFMLSLAAHLAEHPEDYGYELAGFFGYGMPGRETAEFLASVKQPKETDPTTYYSVDQCKVSRQADKRHDKRWFELTRYPFELYYELDRLVSLWHNGQQGRTLTISEWFGLYFALADGLNKSVSFHQSDSLQKQTAEETLQAARVLRELIKSLEAQASAKNSLAICIGNHKRGVYEQTATQKAA